jgi:hypothetical protein
MRDKGLEFVESRLAGIRPDFARPLLAKSQAEKPEKSAIFTELAGSGRFGKLLV